MPKGYWVAHTQINDLIAYKEYQNANAKPLKKFGGKFLVRGGNQELREGQAKGRTVIIEFENLSTAIACYESAEYQAAKSLRTAIAEGDLVIVEGI
ncbi:MAG: DUF1330 domain-containing protein [Proteobacteria bacterium]|jgi:uncharacterized protein (DUF1330 family)|nr:DUF1330 domain-containing protein [Pseudomonadota bacterium]